MDGDIILHDTTGSFLLLQKPKSEDDAPHLLFLEGGSTHDCDARELYHRITGKYSDCKQDPPLVMRYCLDDDDDDDDQVRAYIVEAIVRRCTIQLRAEYSWAKIDSSLMKRMEGRHPPLIIEAIKNIAYETSDDSSCDSVPWFSRGGCGKRVRENIRSRLEQYGYRDINATQYYSTHKSMIFFIQADGTTLCYKISARGSPEAVFTQTLGRLLPDLVVIPFGVDVNDNSFFTKHFGKTIEDVRRVTSHVEEEPVMERLMKSAINTIAEFHEKASEHVEELKKLGMEDTSPQRIRSDLPQFICELQDRGILKKEDAENMRKLIPLIVSKLDVLANGNIPLTVCHGDLHDGNVTSPLADDEVPLLFDWYDSSISHPFLDIMLNEFGRPRWAEMYAEKWRKYEHLEEIRDMLDLARELKPLWNTFRKVKEVIKRGHRLRMQQDWDYCRVVMRRFIEHLLKQAEYMETDSAEELKMEAVA